MNLLVMGVSGSGKTTIGRLLADRLSLPFYDADDFHSAANQQKMKSGQPLTDADRQPWLLQLSEHLKQMEKEGGCVLACSALTQSYRTLLFSGLDPEATHLIYLKGDQAVIEERLRKRKGHYMPSTLLGSQFDLLEEPDDAITAEILGQPQEITEKIVATLLR
ncbi:MAG: gluconokinase [Balneolaceae bacterium]|nr:MAG: gluconokinase [Balneolaceae bacterium]